VCVFLCVYACVYVCVHVCAYVCVCVCMYAFLDELFHMCEHAFAVWVFAYSKDDGDGSKHMRAHTRKAHKYK